jgi:hypothetical protein
MSSPLEILQWVYSRADPAHVEQLLSHNESTLAVVVINGGGHIHFRNDAVADLLSLNDSKSLTGSSNLGKGGILQDVAREAVARYRSSGIPLPSVFRRLPATDRGDWLIVGCCGEFDGETWTFLLIGRGELSGSRGANLGATAANRPVPGELPVPAATRGSLTLLCRH